MQFRKIASTVIAVGLLATPALAQNMTSPANTNNRTNATSNSTTANNNSGMASSLMGDRVQETHGGYLSSKLVGATVYNDQKQSIGSIDNLIVDGSGKVASAVISVGGFLGIGSKLVDVPFSQLQFRPDGSGNATGRQVVLPNATQQSLKSMQDFTYSS